MEKQKVLLMVLDGWGVTNQDAYSAIAHAQTPFIDALYTKYSYTTLQSCGAAVGLPTGQMGNSEVGHLHLGAGRIVPQALKRINEAIQTKNIFRKKPLLDAIHRAKNQQKPLHVMGLLSDGGVHSHIDHIKALCKFLLEAEVPKVFIHVFTDGRDTSPYRAPHFIAALKPYLQEKNMQLATIMGRYYAMDRDTRWDRIKVAYDALVHGKGTLSSDWEEAIKTAYATGTTDEFIQPIILKKVSGEPVATINSGDEVFCFNFRADRTRQITTALTQRAFPAYSMKPLPLYYMTMTEYDSSFNHVVPLFEQTLLDGTLGEVLSQHGKRQLRIAETEKYPHVTYFFSGGREQPFPGEERILCPSLQVPTYDQAPHMAAPAITEQLIPVIKKKYFDFICLNFANPDMVGHTGNWKAAIQACEVIDGCVKQVVEQALRSGYWIFLTSDHGNIEQMLLPNKQPYTAHTLNPVPFISIASTTQHPYVQTGGLIDVAPTILKMMQVPLSEDMHGKNLINPL